MGRLINVVSPTNIVVSVIVTVVTICGSLWLRNRLAHAPAETPTSTRRTRLTFRVRGVPLDWDKSRLQAFLAPLGDPPNFGLTIGSLATEFHGRSLTATVAFQAGGSWGVPLPDSCRSKPEIALDHQFLGITTLYTPSEDHHKVEYVARPPLVLVTR